MEIILAAAETSARAASLEARLCSAGQAVHRLVPGTTRRRLPEAEAAILLDDPSLHLAEAVWQLRERLAFLGTPIVVVTARPFTGPLERLASGSDVCVLGPDAGDDRILTECRPVNARREVDDTTRAELVVPLVIAAQQTLSEMARVEVALERACAVPLQAPMGDISATLALSSARLRSLTVGFTEAGALALTRGVLGATAHVTDQGMIEDCVGEIANVVAGQAKALLAQSPCRFSFSTPKITGLHVPRAHGAREDYVVIVLSCELGHLALQLLKTREQG